MADPVEEQLPILTISSNDQKGNFRSSWDGTIVHLYFYPFSILTFFKYQ